MMKETADLSTPLRSGRDDNSVAKTFLRPEETWACGPPKRTKKRLGPAATLYVTVTLSFVIPSVPGFPASPLSPATTYVVLLKENHMQLTEAATLHRKSGVAEGSAVSGPFLATLNSIFKQKLSSRPERSGVERSAVSLKCDLALEV